jgi:hypothetical protein
MSDKKIRVLIIDDEFLARKPIRRLLDEDPDFEILGECADGQSAITQILESRPDHIFLDIRIPDINGFEVLQLIDCFLTIARGETRHKSVARPAQSKRKFLSSPSHGKNRRFKSCIAYSFPMKPSCSGPSFSCIEREYKGIIFRRP